MYIVDCQQPTVFANTRQQIGQRRRAKAQAFADVLASNEVFTANMEETYRLLDLNPADTTSLDQYLKEYYTQILKKLKEVGASSRQTDFYV